jgi:hypothetical protein
LQGHGLVSAPLADENFACAHNERSGYEAKGRTGGLAVWFGLSLFHIPSVNAAKGMQCLEEAEY